MDNQTLFQQTYISANEITETLQIDRATLTRAVQSGGMPKPIELGNGQPHLWLRGEVENTLKNWKRALQNKRGF